MRANPLYACEAENAGEVSFAASDKLINVSDSAEDGWLLGTVQSTGNHGLFPAVYAELIPESGDDVVFLRKLQAAGLLSSAIQMDTLRHDLDNTHLSTATTQSYSSSSVQQSTYSSSVSYSDVQQQQQQGLPVPVKPVSLTSRPAAVAAASSSPISSGRVSSRASPAPPPISSKPRPVVFPPQQASTQERSTWQQQQQKLSSTLNSSSNLQEKSRQQEIDAARAWEESHLAKKPATLDGSREVSRLVSGSITQTTGAFSTNNNKRPAVPPKPLAGSNAVVSQERLDQERNATASWEQKHLARNKTQAPTNEPRDVSQMFGGSRPVAPKPSRLLGTKPVVSLATKPIVAPRSKAPVSLPSKQQPPLKPATLHNTEEESGYDEERKAAALWEAKHGIGSTRSNSAVDAATKPVFSNGSRNGGPAVSSLPMSAGSSTTWNSTTAAHTQESQATSSMRSNLVERASNPATENDPPPLPYSAVRAARELEQKPKPVRPVNPATANDAPALPFNPTRTTGLLVPEKHVDGSALPSSQHIISRMNSQSSNIASSKASAVAGFADNFNSASSSAPKMASTSSYSSESSMQHSFTTTTTTTTESTTAMVGSGAGIPLTASHQVKGVMPFAGRALPASSSRQQQHSYTSNKSFSQQKQQQIRTMSSNSSINSSNPATVITSDALKRYKHLFGQLDKEEGNRGYLSSEKVRQVVASSRLPDDQLRRIWQLADRKNDGRFDRGGFNIAMYLVDCALRGDPIPEYLPIDLLHSAYA